MKQNNRSLVIPLILISLFSANHLEAWSLFSKPTPQQHKETLCEQLSSVIIQLEEIKTIKVDQKSCELADNSAKKINPLFSQAQDIDTKNSSCLAKIYDLHTKLYEVNVALHYILCNEVIIERFAHSSSLPDIESALLEVEKSNLELIVKNASLLDPSSSINAKIKKFAARAAIVFIGMGIVIPIIGAILIALESRDTERRDARELQRTMALFLQNRELQRAIREEEELLLQGIA